jgi:DNA-binding NarL/FixJ family response regulator
MENKMITIVIADDHPLARAGIHNLLKSDSDLVIVGEGENGIEAMELVEKLRPDVLLLDLRMPGPRPAEIERYVRTNFPETVTLVLTSHDRDAYLSDMIEAGVSGYFSKSVRGEELIKAIHRATEGDNLITEEQLERVRKWHEGSSDKQRKLTKREREILILMSQGLNNADIATELSVTHHTIAFHITSILKKLEVKSRQKAIVWANKNIGDELETG